MKIKYKMIGLFILSIFISVIIFSLATYGILNKGYLSGLTPQAMKGALEEVAQSLDKTANRVEENEIKKLLEEGQKKYKNIRFVILMESDRAISVGQDIDIESVEELITCLSQNGQYDTNRWVIASKIDLNQKEGYLIATANRNDFKTITYYFNGPKAEGVLGKIMLMGLIITLTISSLVTYFFIRNMMQRMKGIDKVVDAFELGRLKVRIEDESSDEIGKLANSFNNMADKIEQQVKMQEEYEEKRKQLISNISHDLRTPLSSVIGYSELLLDEAGENREKDRYIEIIHRKAVYMEKLLKQLLEFSRLENGSLKVQREEADLVECIREILIEYIPSFEEQNIELIVELDENPIMVWFDRDKIERVIRNLIDNALKYGMKERKLRISIYKEEGKVLIEVEDFGIGMDEETLSHVFERFYRGSKGRKAELGGMGLGLSIAQEIVAKHQGILEITSHINQGTKVSITLPRGD